MELKTEIRTIQEKLRRSRKISAHIEILKEMIRKKELDRQIIKEKVNHKKDFVNKLMQEGSGIRKLFRIILGNHEEQLEKERQALLNFILDLKDIESELQTLYYEQKILNSKLDKVDLLKDRLAVIYELRAKEIMNNSVQEKIRWIMLDGVRVRYENKILEIKEAKIHLNHLVQKIHLLTEMLKRISHWKQSDFPNYKQNKKRKDEADEVKSKAVELQAAIDLFHVELKDVWKESETELGEKYEEFKNFVFVLNKSLIMDWIMKKEIKTAFLVLENMVIEAKEINRNLDQQIKENKKKLKLNNKDIDDLMAGWSSSL